DIWANRDRDYNANVLVKRLHRVAKEMSGDAVALFSAFIPDGDVAAYARNLGAALRSDFTGTMAILRNEAFQELLLTYPRPKRVFLVAPGADDEVSSVLLPRDGAGKDVKPEDYLASFTRFVQENAAHIEAIAILLNRPQDWSGHALSELKQKLA